MQASARDHRGTRRGRRLGTVALLATILVLTSGCLYLPSAVRNAAVQPQPRPWWCTSEAGSDLDLADCRLLSAQLDVVLVAAYDHWLAGDAIAQGATSSPYAAGVGAAFEVAAPTASFNPAEPDTFLYTGTTPDSQLAGIEWNVVSATAPEGFTGGNDVWTDSGSGVWTLRAWIARPFEHQVEVFATTHPCLAAGGPILDTTDACYTSTHPRPLEVLVTNDDGYAADGIDAVVEALRTVPGVHVTVVAPAANQSGTSDKTTPGGVTAFSATTKSGYPATAVNGYPADSVLHAIGPMGLNPDLVVSGINFGQNIGPFVPLSGTVGAARTGARNGIPALAASQGFGSPADFPSGAAAVLDWVDGFRLGQAGPPFQVVANVNVPTCTTGSIRGLAELPVAASFGSRPFNPSNCTSSVTTFADDVDGFINGFTTLSDVGT